MKTYPFIRLNKKAKLKAIKEYQEGYTPSDKYEELTNKFFTNLLLNADGYRYDAKGNYIDN